MNDDALTDVLTAALRPVRRVAHPLVSTAIWFLVTSVLVGVGVALSTLRPDLQAWLMDPEAVGEVVIASVTGLLAAHATFQLAIPGRDVRWAWLPALSGMVWLGWLGVGCWSDFTATAVFDPLAETSASCLKFIAAFGLPALLLTLVLARHGFALRPVPVSLLAGLAAAAAADVGLAAIDHPHAALTALIWHGGAALVLMLTAVLMGPAWMRRCFVWHRDKIRRNAATL